MNGPLADDHAVVVGISRYPRFVAEGVAEDLRGPDHDALAVHDWLVDPQGGRLPPANVTLIRSADWAQGPATDPQPASYRVQQALEALEQRTRKRSGRRLYLYFSGHGFAPDLEEAAVYTAEASHRSPAHVYVHSWLRWFRKAQRFAESVLWVDACMNYQQSILAQEVTLREQVGQAVPGPAFIAVAAQTKSALERGMPDGNVHGVFTWTLLLGLRGGAADQRGRVTGRSLQDFLHNAMAEFLPPEVKQAASVDLQPFVRADEGLDFTRLAGIPEFPVTLRLPTARPGQHLRVWTGSPPRVVVDHPLDGGDWQGTLVRGLYVADVPDAGLRQGFQVTGTGPVDETVAATGPPAQAVSGDQRFRIDFRAENAAAAVVLIDHQFQRLYSDTGRLVEDEVPGVYKVRTQFGKDVTTASEQVLLLDRPFVAGVDAPVSLLTTAAPLRGSASTDVLHTRLFDAPVDPGGTGTAALSIMSRYWTDPKSAHQVSGLPHPMAGLQLLDGSGAVVADLADGTDVAADEDPVAVWHRPLEPGPYALRQTLARGVYEGTVVVSPGWVTQIVVRRTTGLGGAFGFASPPAAVRSRTGPGGEVAALEPDDVAVFMRRPSATVLPERDDVVEAARVALTQGRDVFAGGRGHELRRALLEQYDDPVAGIIGAHLLLRSVDGRRAARRDPGPEFDLVVRRLRELVRDPHPDVEALSLRCDDEALRAVGPFSVPPVFVESWRLMVAASYREPGLVPAAVWDRVQANTALGPLLIWAVDEQRRADHLHQLHEWIEACRGPVPEEIREAARRRGIPAAATATLWGAPVLAPA